MFLIWERLEPDRLSFWRGFFFVLRPPDS